jgi:hypothetical protein
MAFSPNVLLSDATIQDIQLELIRRRRFNEFDGRVIVESLEGHRDLWIAAYMSRFGVVNDDHPDWFSFGSLICLRDLRHNHWNVDTLVVLTEDIEHARLIAGLAEREVWNADEVLVQDNEEELSMALGIGPCPYRAVSFWWD